MSLMFDPDQPSVSALLRDAVAAHYKMAAAPELAYSMAGRLYLSKSGWLLLAVPNAVARGVFDALDEQGIELPTGSDGVFNAHISVMHRSEVEALGGGDKISERGHSFRYNLGPIKTVAPSGWEGVSKVWFVEVNSPELQKLRKSYGLTPLPHDNQHKFHITVAIRRKGVLQNNEQRKAASVDPHSEAAQLSQLAGVEISPEMVKEAKSLLSKAVQQRLTQPFNWDSQAGVLGNVSNYFGGVHQNFLRNVEQAQGNDWVRGMYNPQYRWQKLQHILESGDVTPEIQNPLDRLLYRWGT